MSEETTTETKKKRKKKRKAEASNGASTNTEAKTAAKKTKKKAKAAASEEEAPKKTKTKGKKAKAKASGEDAPKTKTKKGKKAKAKAAEAESKGKKAKGKTKKAAADAAPKKGKAKKAKTKTKGDGRRKRAELPDVDEPTVHTDGRLLLPVGKVVRTIAAPRRLNEDQMVRALGRIKLGTDFDIDVGMTLIQKRRDGNDIKVKVVKDGFKYDDEVYPSLSTACQWATHRCVNGNDMFNVEKHRNIVIKGKGVPGGIFRSADEVEEEEEE